MPAQTRPHNRDRSTLRGATPRAEAHDLQPTNDSASYAIVIQQARLAPGSLTPRGVLQAQRLCGNGAVSQVLAARRQPPASGVRTVQRQSLEEEEVQSKPLASSITPLVQRQGDEEEVQTKPLVSSITHRAAGGERVQAIFGWGKKAVDPKVVEKRRLIKQLGGAFKGYTTGGFLLGKSMAKQRSRVQGGLLTDEQEGWIRDLANLDLRALKRLGFGDPAVVEGLSVRLQGLETEQRTRLLSRLPILKQMQISSALLRRTGRAHRGASAEIGSHDIQMELIAHKLVYRVGQGQAVPPELVNLLDNWGFEKDFRRTVQAKGVFAGLLMPRTGQTGVTPVLAFKGTTPKYLADLAADLDPVAVGFVAFQRHKARIKDMASEAGGKVDVTGHSLGGALAQHFTSAFAGSVRRCVTFQAPAISLVQGAIFSSMAKAKRPQVTHHFTTGDIVDLAGGMHLSGKFYRHSPGSGPAQHSSYLLTAPELKKQRDAIGLTEAVMAKLGIPTHTNASPIERFESHPNWFKRLCAEGFRTAASPLGLAPAIISLFQKTKTSELGPTTIRNDAYAAAKPIFAAYLKKAQKAGFFSKASGITAAGIEDAIMSIVALDQRFASAAGSGGIGQAAQEVFGGQVRIQVANGRLQIFERLQP